MGESIIWEIARPEVTLEDLFQAEGADYSKRPPRPGTVELHRRILAEAAELASPAMIWREVAIEGAGEQELHLEGGQKLTSRLLARVAGTADRLILFAITLGGRLDQREDHYSRSGQTLEAFAFSAAGIAFIVKSCVSAMDKIKEHCQASGLEVSFPMGPGHSYWSSLEDMKTMFHFLKAEQIGISLTESNLMVPRKSIAMVLGAGSKLPDFKGKSHCDFCSLQKKCHLSHMGENC